MRKYFLFLLLISGGYVATAQTLQGKVVDETSGEAIPFVSIGIVGTSNTTVSNDMGEFIIKNASFPAKLRYSHVGYELLEQQLTTQSGILTIKLKPASIALSTVTIDPYKGMRLLKAALEKTKSHERQNFYGSAFYRQLTTLNGKPSQIYELFYDLEFNISKIKGWKANQTRFAELNDGVSFSISNQSYLTFSLAGYLFEDKKTGKFVTLKNLKDFHISIDKYIEQKDQNIAVISCRFKGNKKHFYTNSTYYVGTEDLKIYRVENKLFNLPMKISGPVSKMPPIATTIATFNTSNSPVSIIESISTKLYLNLTAKGQPLTPVISSMLTVYQLNQQLNTQKFTELTKNVKDKAIVESIEYNPDFWKDNPIVKQTTLEETFVKMMESKSAFGTMITQ